MKKKIKYVYLLLSLSFKQTFEKKIYLIQVRRKKKIGIICGVSYIFFL